MPTWRASSRLDQCVAPSGTSSRVRTTTSSTWASVMVRGTPGRGSSPSPSSRRARNRSRHFLTVVRLTRSRAATAMLLRPSAQASTIRARSASPCAVFRRFAQFSNVRRSASDSTSGSSLVSPMPPADRGPKIPSPPSRVLRRNTTHVVTRELKTGTLVRAGHGAVLLIIRRSWVRAPPAPHNITWIKVRKNPAGKNRRMLRFSWPTSQPTAWQLGADSSCQLLCGG